MDFPWKFYLINCLFDVDKYHFFLTSERISAFRWSILCNPENVDSNAQNTYPLETNAFLAAVLTKLFLWTGSRIAAEVLDKGVYVLATYLPVCQISELPSKQEYS